MAATADHLRFILGLKLKHERLDRGLSLKQVAEEAGLSISYLSEIEKGRKYPKTEKVLDLARALNVPFDDLISLRVGPTLDPLKQLFSSPLIQEFPFEMFGLEQQDIFGLITEEPQKAGALMQTFLEIGQMYNVTVEHFLFAALRSYQQLHNNYFEDLEAAATAFRRARGWTAGPPSAAALQQYLVEAYNYEIDTDALAADPDLASFRSVYRTNGRPVLYVNRQLLPAQQAFVFAREIGFRELGLVNRPTTSSWIRAESFDQVLNNFKASYFAGALLIAQEAFMADLSDMFAATTWQPDRWDALVDRHQATPEMIFYRLTEVLPERFNLEDIFFMRFHNASHTDYTVMNKALNLSPVPIPHGLGMDEHHCRRWPGLQLLRALRAYHANGTTTPPPGPRAQRSHFMEQDADYFVLSMARPLSLTPNALSCVSIGIRIDAAFKKTVRFWNDPALQDREVNLTCERCPLPPTACSERAAPPSLHREQDAQARKEAALERLFSEAQPSTT